MSVRLRDAPLHLTEEVLASRLRDDPVGAESSRCGVEQVDGLGHGVQLRQLA